MNWEVFCVRSCDILDPVKFTTILHRLKCYISLLLSRNRNILNSNCFLLLYTIFLQFINLTWCKTCSWWCVLKGWKLFWIKLQTLCFSRARAQNQKFRIYYDYDPNFCVRVTVSRRVHAPCLRLTRARAPVLPFPPVRCRRTVLSTMRNVSSENISEWSLMIVSIRSRVIWQWSTRSRGASHWNASAASTSTPARSIRG